MASTAALLLLSLNLLFSTMMVTSQQEPPPPMATPPPPPPSTTCPIDTISSSSCLSALNNTMGLIGSGAPTSIITDCCNLVGDLEGTLGSSQAAQICLCAAIGVPELNLAIQVAAALGDILSVCPNNPLVGFQCTAN
ncbi:hypothetical protein Ahy_B04g069701 [Arachis hypogaea]|uniref:Hydrophobic seed protein domain-containing protein n=1 Tax=Arachis hypogaea TaxID=3818 RepID=A0A444ZD97_ARAHY|nr:hypothetical protein Ahy_B04g069701 [Arachis hypogaea]